MSKNQNSIKKENENINNQNIKLKEQTDKLQKDEYEKILIEARDFLKLIINEKIIYSKSWVYKLPKFIGKGN